MKKVYIRRTMKEEGLYPENKKGRRFISGEGKKPWEQLQHSGSTPKLWEQFQNPSLGEQERKKVMGEILLF